MLTKSDLILVLTELETSGIDIKKEMDDLLISSTIPLSVLKFIKENRELEVSKFYFMIRKNYNTKKSVLYKNIVKEEFESAEEVLTTLSSLLLQINLYAKNLEDSNLFYRHSRAQEITEVLNNYYSTFDLIPCLKLLKVIKADLKCFEQIS